MLFGTDPAKESSRRSSAGVPRSGASGDDPKGQAGLDEGAWGNS